jgi:hypothetical protein
LSVTEGDVRLNSDAGAAISGLGIDVGPNASVTIAATQHLHHLALDGVRLALAEGGDVTLVVDEIMLANDAIIDLADNAMIVRGGEESAIEALISAGRGISGDWQGTGITSSTAATNGGAGAHAVGVILGADAQLDSAAFGGESIANTDVLTKYTYSGDANLDGTVDFDDFNKFLAGLNNPAVNPARWFTGDFNYDGIVNFDDFNKFLAGFKYFNGSGQVALRGVEQS